MKRKFQFVRAVRLSLLAGLLCLSLWRALHHSKAQSGGIYYVSPIATGANDGSSWADAFTSVKSVSPGSYTVYLHGGTNRATGTGFCLYTNMDANWVRPSGVKWYVGQDAGHNGIVIMDGISSQSGYQWQGAATSDTEWNGHVLDAGIHYTNMVVTNYGADIILGTSASGNVYRWMRWPNTHFFAQTAGTFVFDHVYLRLAPGQDHAFKWDGSSTVAAFGSVVYSNCWLELPVDAAGSGFGADGMQNLTRVLCVNTVFYHQPDAGYTSGQHSDSFQSQLSQSIFLNCIFYNAGNYGVYGDFLAPASDVLVFGCLFLRTQSSGGQCAIAMGPGLGSSGTDVFENILCVNNTVVDYSGTGQGISMNCSATTSGHWTNSYALNNLFYNVANPLNQSNLMNHTKVGVTNGWNLAIAGAHGGTALIGDSLANPSGSGTLAFRAYSEYGGLANDFRIGANAYTGSNVVNVLHAFGLTNVLSLDGVNWETNTTPYVGAYQTRVGSVDGPPFSPFTATGRFTQQGRVN